MPPKGVTNNPNGREKGVPNKATTKAREAIALFVDDNSEKLQTWLDQVAADNPAEAFKLFQSVVEYHIPKLSRAENKVEHSGSLLTGIFNDIDGRTADLPNQS